MAKDGDTINSEMVNAIFEVKNTGINQYEQGVTKLHEMSTDFQRALEKQDTKIQQLKRKLQASKSKRKAPKAGERLLALRARMRAEGELETEEEFQTAMRLKKKKKCKLN